MKRISRRNFLKAAGVGAAALSLAACGGAASSTDEIPHDIVDQVIQGVTVLQSQIGISYKHQ